MTTVALYSGGVDSFCMAAIEQPDVLLHVEMGGEYGPTETRRLRTPRGMEDRLVHTSLPLGQWELPPSMIIPARNAFLALAGAQYGDRIIMGSVAANNGSDKDQGFADHMTALMRYIWQPQPKWNPDGTDTRLELPVYHLTKYELVKAAIDAGVTPDDMRDRTFSCYHPANGNACGECLPCSRRWAALVYAGVTPDVDASAAFAVNDLAELKQGNPRNRSEAWVQGTYEVGRKFGL